MTFFLPTSYLNLSLLVKLLLFLGIFVITRLVLNLRKQPSVNPIPEKIMVKLGEETAALTINLHLVISLLLAVALIAVKLLDQYIHI